MGGAAILLQFVTAIGKRIPLLGRLGEVSGELLVEAIYETLTTTLFATAPFWVMPALGHFLYTPPPPLDETLNRGEGLIYASVLLGPLIYIITKRYGRFNVIFKFGNLPASPLSIRFPYGGLFLVTASLTCLISGFTFAEVRRLDVRSGGFNHQGIETLSFALIGGATLIFFLATAYSNMLEDLEKNKAEIVVDEQPKQEGAFLKEWLEAKS